MNSAPRQLNLQLKYISKRFHIEWVIMTFFVCCSDHSDGVYVDYSDRGVDCSDPFLLCGSFILISVPFSRVLVIFIS
ncbi:MAG: hypothetical protein K0S39_2172 [Paenibacillus sp.]|nr:hypothetical protein [Paenibacillus sp.]